jgi:hypothetical protein
MTKAFINELRTVLPQLNTGNNIPDAFPGLKGVHENG